MKKALSLVVVGIAAVGVLWLASDPVSPVDEAKVNAKIDQRLHQIVTSIAAKRASRSVAQVPDWTTVRIAGR